MTDKTGHPTITLHRWRDEREEPSSSPAWISLGLLIAVILLTMFSLHFSIYALGYLAFVLFAQLVVDRYVACTKCPHYGEACPSLPYAGRAASLLFRRGHGPWTQTDWSVIRVMYTVILLTGPLVTFLRGEWPLFLLTSAAGMSWYIVHSRISCSRCANNLVCPKGRMALVGNHQVYYLAAQFLYFLALASIVKAAL